MAHNDSFDEPRFEALYRELYPDLLRCAEIALRSGGGWYVSVAGRAEEVVQEMMQDALFESKYIILPQIFILGFINAIIANT